MNGIKKRRANAMLAVFGALSLLCMAFIFYNGTQASEDSYARSNRIAEQVQKWIDPTEKNADNTQKPAATGAAPTTTSPYSSTVRKSAHGAEYFLLGVSLAGFAVALIEKGLRPVLFVPFVSLATAVFDEYLQNYFERTSSVRDVAIDFAGAMIGAAFVFALYFLARFLKKRKNAEK